jgi:hypothetical protein
MILGLVSGMILGLVSGMILGLVSGMILGLGCWTIRRQFIIKTQSSGKTIVNL